MGARRLEVGLGRGVGVSNQTRKEDRKEAEGTGAVGEKAGLGWESYNP